MERPSLTLTAFLVLGAAMAVTAIPNPWPSYVEQQYEDQQKTMAYAAEPLPALEYQQTWQQESPLADEYQQQRTPYAPSYIASAEEVHTQVTCSALFSVPMFHASLTANLCRSITNTCDEVHIGYGRFTDVRFKICKTAGG